MDTNKTEVENDEVSTNQADVTTENDKVIVKKESRFSRGMKKFFSVGNITVLASLTAISFILYAFVKFPLPFMFPVFLEIQFSDLPALLGGFALGPVAGAVIIVLKCVLKMIFGLSTTAFVGELADILVGVAFVVPAALYYKYHKNRKGALIGLTIGTGAAVAMSLLANWLILIPFYIKAYGMTAILDMLVTLFPAISEATFYNYYLPLSVLPFNLLRCLLSAVLTFLTYKPLSKVLHWEYVPKDKHKE